MNLLNIHEWNNMMWKKMKQWIKTAVKEAKLIVHFMSAPLCTNNNIKYQSATNMFSEIHKNILNTACVIYIQI